MNRPEKKNAITIAMYSAMAGALEQDDRDPAVRSIVITGTNGCFTSGNDVADFLEHRPLEDGSQAQHFLQALSTVGKPVMASVNGLAMGIGVTMLLHCDLVYAADTASFRLPFVNLGLVPEAASSMLLPRLMGHQRASELLLPGESFDARTAREIGLVNKVHPAAGLMAAVQETAVAVASKPPASVRMTKALLKRERESVPARMAEEGQYFGQQLKSPEAREAMEAFLQRRKPDFSSFA
jgi:enoyl-CoA hydratase/carnithine racemase